MKHTVFNAKSLRVLYEFDGEKDQIDVDLPDECKYLEGSPPPDCLYVKQTDQGWQFDPDRLPDKPEPHAVWEYPRWVSLAEQRARHNIGVQARIDLVERKQARPYREYVRSTTSPKSFDNPAAVARAAAKRIDEIDAEIERLRALLWREGQTTAPVDSATATDTPA